MFHLARGLSGRDGLPESGSRAGSVRGSDRDGSERDGSDRDGSDREGSDRVGSERDGSDRLGSERGASYRGVSEREGRSELSGRDGRAGGSLRCGGGSLRCGGGSLRCAGGSLRCGGGELRGASTRGGGSLRCGAETRGASLRCGGGSYDGDGVSTRRSGLEGSTRSRLRVGFSPGSGVTIGSVRVGRDTVSSLGVGDVTVLLRSGRCSPPREGRCEVVMGRVTAPVGLVSTSVALVVGDVAVTVGVAGRASRPFSTRVRRSSSSSGTPGVRAAAPVERSTGKPLAVVLAGRPTVTWPEAFCVVASRAGARAGNPSRTGVVPKARRASVSPARCGRRFSFPICFAFADVTARS